MKHIRKGKRKIIEYKINTARNLGNKIYLLSIKKNIKDIR